MKKTVAVILLLTTVTVFFCASNVFAATPNTVIRKSTNHTVSNVTLTFNAMQLYPTAYIPGSSTQGVAYTPVVVQAQLYNDNTSAVLVNNARIRIVTGNNSGQPWQNIDVFSTDLSIGNYDGTYFYLIPSNDFSYGSGIVVPPKESVYLVATIDLTADWNSTTNQYEADAISSISIPVFTVTTGTYSYGTPVDFSPIVNYLNSMSVDTASISNDMGTVLSDLQTVITNLTDIEYNTDTLRSRLSNIYTVISNIDTDSSAIVTDLGTAVTELTNIKNAILALDINNTAILQKLDTIINNTNTIITSLTTINGNLEDIEDVMSDFYIRNHNDIAAINTLMQTISTKLTNLIDAVSYTGGSPYVNVPNTSQFYSFNAFGDGFVRVLGRCYISKPYITSVDSQIVSNTDTSYLYTSEYVDITYYYRFNATTSKGAGIKANSFLLYIPSYSYRSGDIQNFDSDIFNSYVLQASSGEFNMHLSPYQTIEDSTDIFIPAGYHYVTFTVRYIFQNLSVAPTLPTFDSSYILTDITGTNTYEANSEIDSTSADIRNQSSVAHSQEQAYYQQNRQAIEDTGLTNYRFSSYNGNGIAAVSNDFTDLWTALGSYTSVYIFSLTLGLALTIIRHAPNVINRKLRHRENKDA